ncbi:hypothetical protein [Paenibacillus ehimensis]|uniref:hypothetical protein n=1 Tax=Paenibacillus ehimensis TaxID=79264 RepID=UPI000472E558|nr:hypothetical protein [Paenibacillus ehimensis]
MKDTVDGVTGELTLQVPKELGATAFALLTKMKPIGGKLGWTGRFFGCADEAAEAMERREESGADRRLRRIGEKHSG